MPGVLEKSTTRSVAGGDTESFELSGVAPLGNVLGEGERCRANDASCSVFKGGSSIPRFPVGMSIMWKTNCPEGKAVNAGCGV